VEKNFTAKPSFLNTGKNLSPNTEEFIVNNYDILEYGGVITKLLNQNNLISLNKKIIDYSSELVNKTTLHDLAYYLIEIFKDHFIPDFIGFFSQEDLDSNVVFSICFKDLKQIDNFIELRSISKFNDSFRHTKAAMTFKAFEYITKDPILSSPFIPANPEVIIPLTGQNELYGLIVLGKKVPSTEYNSCDFDFINTILRFASISLQNIIHYRRAIMDMKTKLYNYSFFVKRLFEEISRIKRYNTFCTVALFDIDNFRDVNNKYGHKIGDFVIKNLARIISESLRDSDIAARYGGEEFAVILIQTRIDEAILVMERIRQQIAQSVFKYEQIEVNITVSIGITFIDPNSETHYIDEILKKTDEALFKSKNNGRNRITILN